MTNILERLSTLDPNKFSVEDVAYVMGIWRWSAKLIVDTAVRRREFVLRDDGFYSLIKKETK
jgi:hypothetical protein